MIPVLQHHFEKILLGAAVAALLGGAGWAWRQERSLRGMRLAAPCPPSSGAAYVPATSAPRTDIAAIWRQPPVQSAGHGWVYELFTPPEIYYNAAAHLFGVTPPDGSSREAEAGFDLQLVAVHLEPYRLQLTGYFGSPDDYGAVFTISGSSENVLARTGQRFAQLGLTLKTFAVKKVRVDHGDPWPVYDVAGVATLLDDRAGAEVVLDTRTRKLTETPRAVLQLPGQGKARELHEGDTWVDDSITYRVEHIQLEPAEAVVSRIVSGRPMAETKTVHLPAPAGEREARQAGKGRDFSAAYPGNVASNDR